MPFDEPFFMFNVKFKDNLECLLIRPNGSHKTISSWRKIFNLRLVAL